MPDTFDGVSILDLQRRWGTKWSRHDQDVIPAWIADADLPVCPAVRAAVDRALDTGDLTYPHHDAPLQVAEAFVERMEERYAWSPDVDGVRLMTDVLQGLSFLVDRLTAPGDGVMMHMPGYPPFLQELELLGRRAVSLPFERSDEEWALDFGAIHAAADRGVRLLILVNPHNPTGRVWSRAELDELALIAVERELVVIADEIHAELTLDENEHVPFASLNPDVAERVVTLTSATKSHNMAGVRCAVAHTGPGAFFDAFREVPLSQLGQVSNVGFMATLAAWGSGAEEWLEAFRLAITDRRDRFLSMLCEYLPEVDCLPAQATYLAWVDARPLGLPGRPADWFLDHARVALGAGEDFGLGGEGRVRVNLATSAPILDEIVERMVTSIDLWRGR